MILQFLHSSGFPCNADFLNPWESVLHMVANSKSALNHSAKLAAMLFDVTVLDKQTNRPTPESPKK